jgi:5-methylthioadenosine/S-adenosylhomocysteine deaminase
MSIAIKNGTILTLDSEQQVFDSGYIVIEGNVIKSIGKGMLPEEIQSGVDQVIDANNMLVMPGMVNAHTHLFQTFIRGLGDDLPLYEWLERYIWPVAAGMTVYEAKLSGLLGLVENIRSGATAIIDNQYVHNSLEMDDVYCQAAEQLGVRFLLARGWTDRNYHPAFLEKADDVLSRIADLVSSWNHHPSGRLRVEFGPLSQAKVSDESMMRAYALAQEWGVGLHMHTSETRGEVEDCLNETGLRPVEWLDSIGCLGPGTQVVHAVWLSDHELDLIAERGATVVHCPVSNMYLASGVARVPEMVQKGIPVALATDGPGSNNNQDMVETLKTTVLLHKVNSLNARVFLPEEILWMACRGGAQAFGQPQDIGSLEVGKKADIVLVDLNTVFAVPVHRPVSALVYNLNGNSVDTVIIDGQVVMQGKKILVIDEQALLQECREAGAALIKRVNRIPFAK